MNLGNGNGTFKAAATYTVPSIDSYVKLHDIDDDGQLDTFVIVNNGIAVLRGNSDGSFTAATIYTGTITPQGFALLDTNSDGILDLVTGTQGTNRINLFLGNSNGTFKTMATAPSKR